jgi:mannose-1-phosphate guanylyltransferase/mannose-6-phosphate isomerase
MPEINSKITVSPVILCGGSGTRLWPLSRSSFPKQFLEISGKISLFQQAVKRVKTIVSNSFSFGELLVVTADEHRFIALEQLRKTPTILAKLILEPEPRNTAPALTLAALEADRDGKDPILVIIPADQMIKDSKTFVDAIERSIKVADSGAIVVLGINPTRPETSFGYIKRTGNAASLGEFNVEQFIEKPNLNTAKAYIASGDYSWNSGIFVVRASIWLKALSQFRPDIKAQTEQAFLNSSEDETFVRPNADLFHSIPSESIDYAVIEKCPGTEFAIKMIPLDERWSDLGSWDAVWNEAEKDNYENMINGDVLAFKTSHSLIHSSHRLVSVVGLNNTAVIETADAILVADLNHSQYIKEIVSKLTAQNREEHMLHRKVFRPWGWYDTIDVGEHFKVKRIQVNPGASLSLQKHYKRTEHWVVVKGVAEIVCGDKKIILKENESTYIPLGEKHRLSNPFGEALEIIEVQSGSYLGEDDIVRLEDGYGRNKSEG